jgi:hypothetical protein
MYFMKPSEFVRGEVFYSTGTKRITSENPGKILPAYSIPEGKLAWRYPQIGTRYLRILNLAVISEFISSLSVTSIAGKTKPPTISRLKQL